MGPDQGFEEVRKSVAGRIERGTLLRVGVEAMKIAKISGMPADEAAEQLRRAAITARINLELSAPTENEDRTIAKPCPEGNQVGSDHSVSTAGLANQHLPNRTARALIQDGGLPVKDNRK